MMNYKHLVKLPLVMLLINPLTASYAQSMTCHANTDGNNVKMVVTDDGSQQRGVEAVITVDDNNQKLSGHFYNLTQLWDGHMTGMMTNEGISIKYDNNFSQIRNVDATAYVSHGGAVGMGNGWIKSFHFESCSS